MAKITILLAEDEPALGQIIKESLETRNFLVHLCCDGEMAWKCFQKESVDIAVLDIMMPKKDGFTLAKEIRQIDERTPILFLTAKSQTSDVVEGFTIGGNDYLKKPFSIEELIVRINNLLDRISLQNSSRSITVGRFKLNLSKQTLRFENEPETQLTHREAHLLFHLAKNSNQVLDRSFILNKLWGNNDYFSARSMDVFISKLRKKLARDENLQIINIRGYGYKLVNDIS
ncbi:response regulator transcription factor [Flavobacteriaceae bacterium F08102]|nr:response regulator transcription factor [Flavobacteriaceae bacterium F08102]